MCLFACQKQARGGEGLQGADSARRGVTVGSRRLSGHVQRAQRCEFTGTYSEWQVVVGIGGRWGGGATVEHFIRATLRSGQVCGAR